VLARNGAEFTAEDVREWVGDPPHPNALGARVLAAVKADIIVRTGYRKATRREAHARVLAVYRGVL
jgi:hypothetical protein